MELNETESALRAVLPPVRPRRSRCVHKSKWPKDSMRQVSLSHIYLTLAQGPAILSLPRTHPLLQTQTQTQGRVEFFVCSQFTQDFLISSWKNEFSLVLT